MPGALTGHTAWLFQPCRDHLKQDIFERAHEFVSITYINSWVNDPMVLSVILSIKVLGRNIHLGMSSSSLSRYSSWNKTTYGSTECSLLLWLCLRAHTCLKTRSLKTQSLLWKHCAMEVVGKVLCTLIKSNFREGLLTLSLWAACAEWTLYKYERQFTLETSTVLNIPKRRNDSKDRFIRKEFYKQQVWLFGVGRQVFYLL